MTDMITALGHAILFMFALLGAVVLISLAVAKILSMLGIDSFCAYYFWVCAVFATIGLAILFWAGGVL